MAQELRRTLAKVALWGEFGVFLLTVGVLAGPFEVTGAAIALIAGFQSLPSAALGGLLTLTAVAHGITPEDMEAK